MKCLMESHALKTLLAAAALANATPVVSGYVAVPDEGLVLLITKGARTGGTGTDAAATFTQATDSGGSGAKSLTPVQRFTKLGTSEAAQFTRSSAASPTTLTSTHKGFDAYLIRRGDLDLAGGFGFVQVSIQAATADGQIIAIQSAAQGREQGAAVTV